MNPYYNKDGITIYCGDCREVMPKLKKGIVDLAFTSPPYNCGLNYGKFMDNMPRQEYFSMIESAVHGCAVLAAPGGYIVVNAPSWIGSRTERVFAFDEYRDIMGRHLLFDDLIIWDKGPANGAAWGNYATSPRIRAGHEWLFVYRAGGKRATNSDISWFDWSRLTQSIWRIPNYPLFSVAHPATFPVELAKRVLLLYSPVNGCVIDPFMGTGTTLRAAKDLGRRAIGIEINPEYCDLAIDRLRQGVLFETILT